MSAPTPKEIRECFQDYRSEWQEIRDEAAEDMRAISPSGPWANEDRQMRKDAGRPCVHLDQINQYLNQTSGNVRKNKRAVKAIPKGNGANDQDAEKRSSLIMGIEERSKAQAIYLHAFQCMIERSYGFSVLRTEYKDDSSFDQEILIKPILNPDTVLISPHYKQPDASDIPDGFLVDQMAKRQFKQKWPNARVTDFTDEETESHVSNWVQDKTVQVGEYWKVEYDTGKLLLVETQHGPIIFSEQEWKAAKETGIQGTVKRERERQIPRVMQYWTNGVEILDEIRWAGSRIPIISCLGPERWQTVGGTAKRELLSMVRFAREPQMLFDFLSTQECEEAGMVPKVPFVGYKGQFESDAEVWEEINKVPHAFVQADLIIDASTGAALPLPARPQYVANFQQYEMAKDSAARSLQSSMGITPLPTAAQRRNEKSGVALEKIDDMESLGSFHFVDRYETNYLGNMGWQINELITPILDTPREMPVTQPDGSRDVIHVVGNTSHPLNEAGEYEPGDLPENHVHTGKGDFDVTIATGPSYQSEREEQSAFVDQLLQNLPNLPPPGTPQAKVLALAIRMRPNLGPIGKQIADVFDPPDPSNLPPEAQAAVAQLQGQLQQLQQENQALHMDRAGRVLEQQTKMNIEQMKTDTQKQIAQLQNDIKVLVAEIQAKSQDSGERMQMYKEFWLENHGAAHEVALQKDQQMHEHAIADKAAATQAAQLAAQQAQPDQTPATQQT
jgi:Phage P22-like portal protein